VNDDRVSELYLGEHGFAATSSHKPCRARIDWIVSEARGRTLDIGCSQGIVSILLGRAGHEVTGVEIEEPAIAYARNALAAEPPDVQQRVRLVEADIYSDAIADQRFDTVVLGEILEHHATPRALWLRAAELVAPGGRLVGTTPFGLHPHPDHKVTFYLRSFIDTIAGVGTLTHLDIQDGFIRFVVRTDPEARAVEVDGEALLARSEQGFLAIQLSVEAVRVELKTRGDRIATLNERATTLRQQLEHAKADLATQREELRTARRRLEELERFTTPPEDAPPQLRGLSAFLASLLREVNTGGLRESPLQALRKTYARVRRELTGA
jgi:2-polyprenyl-3-methyl-5-hydroxy-6-metoxy-1,4-benzoquinol methylase